MPLLRAWRDPRTRSFVVAIPLVVVIGYFYAYLASSGTFEMIWPRPDYYDRMCEGFRAGHLYIVEQPKAALLAKADPFARENFKEHLWLWDASLYKGHYYVYWGPVPGLLLLAWKVLTGYVGHVSDQWSTVCYLTGRLVCGSGLILGLAKYLRSAPPTWLVTLCVAVFGLSAPIPFIVSRPDVYEASLAAGQCFLFAGLWAAFGGVTRERHRTFWFVLASVMWALAFGSRATAFVPVPFFIAATVFFVWQRRDRSLTSALKNAMALGIPFACAVAAYGMYNYVRFDSPFEFGTRYQVTLQPFSSHSQYVIPNVYSYLFAPLKWSCAFPFVETVKDRPLSTLLYWPAGYRTFEKVSGVLVMGGFLWLQFLLVYWGMRKVLRRLISTGGSRYSSVPYVHHWALVGALGLILSLGPALGLWEASMRYAGDAIGGMTLAAVVAAFWLVRESDESRSRLVQYLTRTLVLLLGLHSCFVGAFTAFAPAGDHFKRYNPALYQQLVESLSLC
jgi:hypothetical protein